MNPQNPKLFLLILLLTISLITLTLLNFTSSPLNANTTTQSTPPKPYGLVGDGKTDDTAALQQAINNATGSITIPRGRYKLSKTITIDLNKTGPTSIQSDGTATFIMTAPGPAFHFIGTHKGTADPKTVKPEVWTNQRAPMVDGIEIIGQHPQANGIQATYTMQLTITRTVIRKAHHAIHLTTRNRNVIISNCHLYENNGIGVYLDKVDLHQINITGSHISYNKLGGIVSRAGGVRNLHIGTCDIEGNMGNPESTPTANVLLDSTNGSIAEVAITGCTIQHTHNAPNSANIRFIGKSTKRNFTSELRHGHLTIADNVLSDAQINIDIQQARGITITGNTLWKGYTHNLKITDTNNLTITGNMLERNPRYSYGDEPSAKLGSFLKNIDGCNFTANHLRGYRNMAPALTIENATHFQLANNNIIDCERAFLINNLTHSRISGNIVHDTRKSAKNSTALTLTNAHHNIITNNLFAHPFNINSTHSIIKNNTPPTE